VGVCLFLLLIVHCVVSALEDSSRTLDALVGIHKVALKWGIGMNWSGWNGLLSCLFM